MKNPPRTKENLPPKLKRVIRERVWMLDANNQRQQCKWNHNNNRRCKPKERHSPTVLSMRMTSMSKKRNSLQLPNKKSCNINEIRLRLSNKRLKVMRKRRQWSVPIQNLRHLSKLMVWRRRHHKSEPIQNFHMKRNRKMLRQMDQLNWTNEYECTDKTNGETRGPQRDLSKL